MSSSHDIDTDVVITRAHRVHCELCGDTIDRTALTTFQYIAGWAKNRKGGGAHSVTLPEHSSRWACGWCIDKLRHGIAIGQTKLF